MNTLKWINYLIMCCVAFFNLVTFIIDQYVWTQSDMSYPWGSIVGLGVCICAYLARNEAFKRERTVIKEPNCFCMNLSQIDDKPNRITTVY